MKYTNYDKALAADKAFQDALEEEYGSAASEMRYARVLPSRLALLAADKRHADELWLADMRRKE